MDAITGLFSSLGDTLSSGGPGSELLKILGIGSGVAGTVGNISANNAKNQVLNSEMQQMKAYQNLTPADVAKGTSALEQPLSANLVSSVGNTVQGQLAERGLSQAPGIYASSLAQGLAPYQLQEQQLAQQAFFQKLGLPISARPSPFGPYPNTTNQSQLFGALARNFMGQGTQPNNFSYWAGNNAQPFQTGTPGLVNMDFMGAGAPDLGTPDWMSQLTGLSGLVPTSGPAIPSDGGGAG